MNFLAHFYLSGNDTGLLLGNFLADAVKGKKYLDFSAEIQRGILMHRFIDHFTDTHAVTEQTKVRLRPRFHHYAPVVVDVFFDHFLAKNWKNYSNIPLRDFAEKTYAALHAHSDVFPEKSKHILKYMEMHDWLSTYATVEGIDGVMHGMARRTPFASGMENSAEALVEHYDAYEADFAAFFPLLQEACAKFIAEK